MAVKIEIRRQRSDVQFNFSTKWQVRSDVREAMSALTVRQTLNIIRMA